MALDGSHTVSYILPDCNHRVQQHDSHWSYAVGRYF